MAAAKVIKAKVQERQPYRQILLEAARQCTEAECKRLQLSYLATAISLLQAKPWDDDTPDASYTETLTLYTEAAEAKAHVHADAAVMLLETILANARDVFHKIPAYILLSRIRVVQGDSIESFRVLQSALSGLGLTIRNRSVEECRTKFKELVADFEALEPFELESRQLSDDDTLIAIAEVLTESMSTAWVIDILQFFRTTLDLFDLTLHKGITTQAGLALSSFATIAISRFDLVHLGVKLGMMADAFFERFEDGKSNF